MPPGSSSSPPTSPRLQQPVASLLEIIPRVARASRMLQPAMFSGHLRPQRGAARPTGRDSLGCGIGAGGRRLERPVSSRLALLRVGVCERMLYFASSGLKARVPSPSLPPIPAILTSRACCYLMNCWLAPLFPTPSSQYFELLYECCLHRTELSWRKWRRSKKEALLCRAPS